MICSFRRNVNKTIGPIEKKIARRIDPEFPEIEGRANFNLFSTAE
jgi:hypothetical protein